MKNSTRLFLLLLFVIAILSVSTSQASRRAYWFLSAQKAGTPGRDASYLLSKIRASNLGNRIIITNPQNYDLIDYQVRVDLSSASNFPSPFMIVDSNENPIPYCFEQSNSECNTNPTNVIWIKVPRIPANGNIVLHVRSGGGPTFGENIFDYYEDFSHVNTSDFNWTASNRHYFYNGYLYLLGTDVFILNKTFDITATGTEIKIHFRIEGVYSGSCTLLGLGIGRPSSTYYKGYIWSNCSGLYSSFSEFKYNTVYPSTYYQKTVIYYPGLIKATLTLNKGSFCVKDDSPNLGYANRGCISHFSTGNIKILIGDGGNAHPSLIYFLRIRKYVTPEPAVTLQ